MGEISEEQLAAMQSNFDGTLASIYKSCLEQGVNIPEGLRAGIEQSAKNPIESAANMVNSIIQKTKDLLQSRSPSKVMQQIGADVDKGMANGIDGGKAGVSRSMSGIADAVKKAVANLPADATRTGESVVSGFSGAISGGQPQADSSGASLANSALSGLTRDEWSFNSAGSSAASRFASGIGDSSAYNEGTSLGWTALNGIGSVDAYNTGWNFIVGFSNGMNGPDLWNAAWNLGNSALSAIKSALGIKSPSKEAMEVGEFFGEGAVLGMRKTEQAIADESQRMSDMMELNPTNYQGGWQGSGRASNGQPRIANVNMEVSVIVNAASAEQGKAAGVGVADGIFEQINRKIGANLWPASYSMA